MPLSQNPTKEALAAKFTELGSWVAVFKSDGNEASGGSPAYARVQTTWPTGDASDGIKTGSQVEVNLPTGTYDAVGIYSASTGGTLVEKIPVTSTTFGGQAKLLVTPTYTQT